MTLPLLFPPGNSGFGLGEPFDARSGLLLAYDDARKALHRAQVDGDRDAIRSAEWALTERAAELEAQERHLADEFLLSLRLARKHRADTLSDLLSDVPAVVELANAVAALEDKGVRR